MCNPTDSSRLLRKFSTTRRLASQNTLINKIYLLESLPVSGSIEQEISKVTILLFILDYGTYHPAAKGLSLEYCSLFFNLKTFQGPERGTSDLKSSRFHSGDLRVFGMSVEFRA